MHTPGTDESRLLPTCILLEHTVKESFLLTFSRTNNHKETAAEGHSAISWILNFTRGILKIQLALLLQRVFFFPSYFEQKIFPVFLHLHMSTADRTPAV
jgi:hypothetical protein